MGRSLPAHGRERWQTPFHANSLSGCWLKTTLVQAAWAAARTRDSYLRAQFLRLKPRRGPKKAILAVAASMLTAIYHMLLHLGGGREIAQTPRRVGNG